MIAQDPWPLLERVFGLIENERRKQNTKWNGWYDQKHDQKHTPAEWIALIASHAGRGMSDNDDSRYLFTSAMVRVAALACAAIEANFERLGIEE